MDIAPGHSRRIDCPFCGGSNSLGINNELDGAWYNCFKAGCDTHGRLSSTGHRSVSDLVAAMTGQSSKADALSELPEYFTQPTDGCFEYVEKYPLVYKELTDGNIDVLFDPREQRCCFIYGNGDIGSGAVGRTLCGGSPKWRRYGTLKVPFCYGPRDKRSHGVLVEDVPSAIAVGSTGEYTGISFLGTSIPDGAYSFLKGFGELSVALDWDAALKGLDYANQLDWLVPTAGVILDKDFKVYGKAEICQILKQRVPVGGLD